MTGEWLGVMKLGETQTISMFQFECRKQRISEKKIVIFFILNNYKNRQ